MKSYSLQADGRDPYHVQVKILKCQMNNPLKKKKKTHAALELQATEDGVSSKVELLLNKNQSYKPFHNVPKLSTLVHIRVQMLTS